jgi:hypothetical protein
MAMTLQQDDLQPLRHKRGIGLHCLCMCLQAAFERDGGEDLPGFCYVADSPLPGWGVGRGLGAGAEDSGLTPRAATVLAALCALQLVDPIGS